MSKDKEKNKKSTGRKELFGSSSKSDFIVNMTAEGAQKMCGIYSIMAVVVVMLMAIPYYFTQNIVDYTNPDDGSKHFLADSFIYYTALAVVVAGCLGFLIFLIAYTKKQVSIKNNKTLLCCLAVILLSAVSAFSAADVNTAIFGYKNRYEGLLTILGYWGFFSVGMCITAEKRRRNLIDFLVGVGAFQAVVGILQKIPATAKLLNNPFDYVQIRPGTSDSILGEGQEFLSDVALPGIYVHDRAVTGFLFTPFAFAAAMSVLFTVAAAGFVFEKSKGKKAYYGVSALLMACASMLTNVLAGVIGIGTGAAAVLLIALLKSFGKDSKSKSPLIFALSLICVSGVAAGIFFGTGTAKFRDERIMFTDSYIRSDISNYFERLDKSMWIYEEIWDDGMYAAQQSPFSGAGPDNWNTIYTYGSLQDRSYNEYVDVASYRGFPCAAFYIMFVLITLWKMYQIIKRFVKNKESWIAVAACAGGFAYFVQAFFNSSWITSAVFMWLIVGLVWSSHVKSKTADEPQRL